MLRCVNIPQCYMVLKNKNMSPVLWGLVLLYKHRYLHPWLLLNGLPRCKYCFSKPVSLKPNGSQKIMEVCPFGRLNTTESYCDTYLYILFSSKYVKNMNSQSIFLSKQKGRWKYKTCSAFLMAYALFFIRPNTEGPRYNYTVCYQRFCR